MDAVHKTDEGRDLESGKKITRRELLRFGGTLALASIAAPIISACGSNGGGAQATPTTEAAQAGASPTTEAAQAGASPTTANLKGDLVIWTFFDQVKLMGEQFEKKYPDVNVDVKVFPGDQYETKMRLALQTGQDAPDIFDLERGYIGKYINSPFPENLSAMGAEELVKDYVPYVAALGKDEEGNFRAVSDHSSPGGFWYRRDIAEQYLGTGDPEELSEKTQDWDQIIELGKQVAEQSNGQVHMLANYSDVIMVNQYHMEPWVVEGQLNIDSNWNEVLDTARKIRENNVDAKLDAFSPAWGSAWNDGSVLMFAWPSWAGFLIDQEKTADKWAIAKAPKGYYAGGTYRAIYTQSKNKELAYEFVKFIASSEWQNYNLEETLNMPGLQSVYQENMDTFRHPLLGDQPVLRTYFPIAMDVPARPADEYGEAIQSLFNEVVGSMINNNWSNDEAFQELKKQVNNAYPELTVE